MQDYYKKRDKVAKELYGRLYIDLTIAEQLEVITYLENDIELRIAQVENAKI